MANVKVFVDKLTDAQTNDQQTNRRAKNYMHSIYRCGAHRGIIKPIELLGSFVDPDTSNLNLFQQVYNLPECQHTVVERNEDKQRLFTTQ